MAEATQGAPTRAPDVPDPTILTAARGGDSAAFDQLARQHLGICHALARRVVRDEHMAQDAVQEALTAAWRTMDGYDPERSTLRSWLLMLTHRKAVDRVRSEERRRGAVVGDDVLVSVADDRPGPADVTWERQRAREVRAALQSLPETQREVLVLCYFSGLTQREVAERTDTPLGTVKTRTLAALRRLRAELEVAVT